MVVKVSDSAISEVTTYDDGKFERTAIIIEEGGVSFDLLDKFGNRVAQINAFSYFSEHDPKRLDHVIIDVIDIDKRFGDNCALTFTDGMRKYLEASNLVSVDLKRKVTS